MFLHSTGNWDNDAGHVLSMLGGEFYLALSFLLEVTESAGHYLTYRRVALISASVIPHSAPVSVDSCICVFTFCVLFYFETGPCYRALAGQAGLKLTETYLPLLIAV